MLKKLELRFNPLIQLNTQRPEVFLWPFLSKSRMPIPTYFLLFKLIERISFGRMQMKKLGWGILSTGAMSNWFCSDFHAVHNGDLVAVCSRSQERADAFASQYDIPATYNKYQSMLADPNVDIVYISSPRTAHKQNILDALAAGKHVLCEKPIVTSLSDMNDVIEAANNSGKFLAEALWTWHLPALRKAKEWIDTGSIGELLHVKVDFGFPIPYSPKQHQYDLDDAGGVVREMGIYPVAIAKYFIDSDPDTIHVIHQNAPNGVEDDVIAILNHGKVTATLSSSMKCHLNNDAHIIGTKGHIVIPQALKCREAMLYQMDDIMEHYKADRTELGYHYQAIQAGEDIANGLTQSSVVSLSDSRTFQHHMELILNEIRKSDKKSIQTSPLSLD